MQSKISPCPVCLNDYDQGYHIPKVILNCGHTICAVCLASLLESPDSSRCPLDKRYFCPGKTGLNDFPSNFSLLQIIEEARNEQSGQEIVCSEHREKKMLFCTIDRVLVCNDCVIFGEHKGHDMKRTKEFEALFKDKTERVELALDILESHCSKINKTLYDARLLFTNSIKSSFQELRQQLYKMELELLYQSNSFIDKQANEIYKVLRDSIKLRSELAKKLGDYKQPFKYHDFAALVEEDVQELTSQINIEFLSEKTQKISKTFNTITCNLNETASLQTHLLSNINLPISNLFEALEGDFDEPQLESLETTLKKENIGTLFKLADAKNIQATINKLLGYFDSTTGPLLQKDLVEMIIQLMNSYSSEPEWYIKVMNQVLEKGGEHVDTNMLSNMLKLIDENLELDPNFNNQSSSILQLPNYFGRYSSVFLDLDSYEETWSILPSIVVDDMQSNVRSVYEIKNVLNMMSLKYADGVENEVLGMGRHVSGNLVLVSTKIDSNGILEFQSKSSDEHAAKELIDSLKQALQRLFWIL